MPNKTIYVPDSDMAVFEQAQKMTKGSESLSSVIIRLLRDYIRKEVGDKERVNGTIEIAGKTYEILLREID